MRLLSYFILSILLYSCGEVKKKDVPESKEKIKINTGADLVYPDTIFVYDKQKVLMGYVKQLKDSLKENKIPNFIYDECLDANSMGYCNVSSHETISLRTDIINTLKKEEIHKILEMGNKEQLKRKCRNNPTSELFNSNKSTFEILREASH